VEDIRAKYPENKRVCICKGVSLYAILDAIHFKNAKSQEDIERITNASTGCGRCRIKVERIVLEVINQ
jgi:NAD(P)H-nitrite reductase large subunit